MTSNYGADKTVDYIDFNNRRFIVKNFTDLQSCHLPNDTDSQSSYSNSSDLDDNDNERQVNVHFSSLMKEENLNKVLNNVIHPKSSNDIIELIREDLYKFVFMPISKQFNNYVRCRLIRNKFDMVHTFRLEVERQNDGGSFCLLTAEKQFNVAGSTQFTISVIPKFTKDCYFAELQSTNITGTSYSLYDLNGDERQRLAVILYESNFLGLKGPRKIEVLLPKFNSQMESLFENDDFVEYNSKDNSDCYVHLHNKPPDWDPNKSAYTLKFDDKSRVMIPSIKNFQMMIESPEYKEHIVMQFGRMSENEFSCDFRYPLSLMQAFGIALSAFDSRLFRD